MTNLHRLSFSLLLATALLAGCSTPTTPPGAVAPIAPPAQRVEQLLQQASRLPATAAAELRLQATRLSLQLGDRARARAILAGLEPAQLPPMLAYQVAQLQAQLLTDEDPTALLANLERSRFAHLPADQLAELGQWRAEAWLQLNDPLAAVRELIVSSLLTLDPDRQQQYHDRIWSWLQQIPPEQLQQAAQADNDYQEQGWFELALMLQASPDLAARQQALERWTLLWESHPAMILPPAGLLGLEPGGDQLNARRIGVILPLSGELAEPAGAIRKGMEAQVEILRRAGQPAPELVMLDSTGITDASLLLAQAHQQGVELLIGPLDQQLIRQLAQMPERALPVLALNPAEPGPAQPWQLELSSEHEARMVARRALADGHQRLLLITPAAEWGDRIASVMEQTLTEAGARVVGHLRYQAADNYDDQVAGLLLTGQSVAREQRLRALLRQPLEFQERRRQDADAILLTALPEAARLIKPMLDYHFAADLPVYATSHLYVGYPDATRDVDLNGITFCDLPWLLQPPSEAHRLLSSSGEDTLSRFGRLYALGVDAIRVYPWLPQLEQRPGSYLQGETGRLSMDASRRLQRELSCTRFSDGEPASLHQEATTSSP